MIECQIPSGKPNPGYCPADADGKRVRVQLTNGKIPKDNGHGLPDGWKANGPGGCRWKKTGGDFDIAFYKVL